MFANRTDAGHQLADLLDAEDVEADIALAIPRGGLPVGRAVADRLGIPLDVVVAKKLGAPYNPELAIGAVAADGSLWRNDDLIRRLGVPDEYVDRQSVETASEAREKAEQYRGDRPFPDLDGKRVLLVDDGLATGATAIACLRQIRGAGASRVILAVPVAPPDTVAELEGSEADEVIAVETPPHFGAVGEFYRSFEQVPDERALEYLHD